MREEQIRWDLNSEEVLQLIPELIDILGYEIVEAWNIDINRRGLPIVYNTHLYLRKKGEE